MIDIVCVLRFVIQQHDKQGKDTHWDLMLEQGEILKTYRLDKPPQKLLTETATTTPIFDHEKRFLTYEGPVNQGLGSVEIQEHGTYKTISQTAIRWHLNLQGIYLKGHFLIETTDHEEGRLRRLKKT